MQKQRILKNCSAQRLFVSLRQTHAHFYFSQKEHIPTQKTLQRNAPDKSDIILAQIFFRCLSFSQAPFQA